MKNKLTYNEGFLTVPVAIIVAGIVIAAAIIFAIGRNAQPQVVEVDDSFASGDVEKMKPVDDSDHILGDAGAPIKVVEYSDTECPFCKNFHKTMTQAVAEYEGKVAWVYRHFPLDAIHSQARQEAEAAECAAALGGNEAFWKYINRLFEITPSNNNLNLAELPKIAEYAGLNVSKFNDCLKSGQYAKEVEDDYQDGLAAGAQGTPYSVAISGSGKKFVINGAQPLSEVKKVLDNVLQLGDAR